MRTLLVDHHDSFTWNLVQAIAELAGVTPDVVEHDDDALLRVDWGAYDAVVLSPGPGRPDRPADARHTAAALRAGLPVLGVCLGMQLLTHHAGGRVVTAPAPMHGRTSLVRHDGDALFAGIPSPAEWVRYHSLACVDLPDTLVPTAWADDGVLMALRHRERPWWGVQFHPESVASAHGRRLLANFLDLAGTRRPVAVGPRRPALPPAPPILHAVHPHAVDTEALHAAAFAGAMPSVWLDGAATRDGTRFSILGDATGPLAHWLTARGDTLTVRSATGTETHREHVWEWLRRWLTPVAPVPEVPFALGFVGALGYELRATLGSPVHHRSALPDAALVYLDRAVVVDHVADRTWLLALDHAENRAWLAGMTALLATLTRLETPLTRPSATLSPPSGERDCTAGTDTSSDTSGDTPSDTSDVSATWRHPRPAYRDRVVRAQAWLAEGESYELNLTNQASVPFPGDPIATYRALRRLNPAPYAALLRFPDFDLLSSSPERFLRVDRDRRVTAEPIKGTRRREVDPAADARAAADLAASEKDRSENLMIVDLLRNDLGRVCDIGSVRVPRLFAVESFATVHQLVSTIEGRLRDDADVVELLRASFPPGSMTGAPKLRSMALLEALEEGPRGPYSGVVGWLSRCGAADLSVVIRTAVIADGVATVGVGGAVVALSDPDAEVAEMELKAEAVLRALGARP